MNTASTTAADAAASAPTASTGATIANSASPSPTSERCINDIFDEINSADDQAEQRAYDEGFSSGAGGGNSEGYHLGYHRGAELGAELGYYTGVVRVYRHHLEPAAGSKLETAFAAVERALNTVPADNDPEVEIFERVDKVRSLYRRLCALLKINGRYPEADTLNF